MSDADFQIRAYLEALRTDGKSNPRNWDRFDKFLQSKRLPGADRPPVPLILAASSEAPATKHWRLGEELIWAQANGCLSEALDYLKRLPDDEWETSSPERWHRDGYERRFWSYEEKTRPGDADLAAALRHLQAHWSEIAGSEVSKLTEPIAFSGEKGRRLEVRVTGQGLPPWGSWTSIDHARRSSFTRLRAAVNAAIKPLEVDHIDFIETAGSISAAQD